MTDTLREREKSEEAKYKLDEERHFKIVCRRNKLFAHWAASRLGLEGSAAEDYARAMVMLLLDDHDQDAVLRRVNADFRAAGIATDDVDDALAQCYTHADEQLAGDWHALGADHVQIGG